MSTTHHLELEQLYFEGNQCLEGGDHERAESCFRQALELCPDFAEALANLGFLHERTKKFAEAERCYRRAIVLRPDCVQIHLNLGVLLMTQKRFVEAESIYRQALKLVPSSPSTWSNLGVLYACMKREEEAERCYRTAIELDEDYAKAKFNLSYILLRQGRFEEGWQCLESRDTYETLRKHFTCPRWEGDSLARKTIVIGFEAGHGDMIQFCRYVSVLKDMGAAHITIVCHPGLKRLFGGLTGVDAVFSFHDVVPTSGWDFWTPLLSIPLHCKTDIDSIPTTIPYLRAIPSEIEKWASLLPKDGLRVGLAWKGNPLFENDTDRSLPSLEVLAPLWTVEGVTFISLQKGAGEEEAENPPRGLSLINLGSQLDDFANTAAVVASLDLVITVDTALAHLAGALGKPCWVLLPYFKTDWRWLTNRSDSPWYPGVTTLFRQPSMGGWAAVIPELVTALNALMLSKISLV